MSTDPGAQRDMERATAERQHEQSAERRERLRAAKDRLIREAVARFVWVRASTGEEATREYLALLIGDGHRMTEDEQRAARLLGLVE